MPRGPLEVSAAVSDRRLVITISDRGRGMRPRTDSPGLGVGLSLIGELSNAVEVLPRDGDRGTQLSVLFEDAIPAIESPPWSRLVHPRRRTGRARRMRER